MINNAVLQNLYNDTYTKYNDTIVYGLSRKLNEINIDNNSNVSLINCCDSGYCVEKFHNDIYSLKSYTDIPYIKDLESFNNNIYIKELIYYIEKLKSNTIVLNIKFNGIYIEDYVKIINSANNLINDIRYFHSNILEITINTNNVFKILTYQIMNDLKNSFGIIENELKILNKISVKTINIESIDSLVFQNGTFGIVVHEAIGHMLEADHFTNNTYLSNYKNIKCNCDDFVVKDNPNREPKIFKMEFDDQGNKCKEKILYTSNGINDYLSTNYYKSLSLPCNARRENFRKNAIPRMSNTFVENGHILPNNIIKSIKNGVLIKNINTGFVNPINGKIRLSCNETYKIDNGEQTYLINDININLNVKDIFSSIKYVGNDLIFKSGSCIKNNQNINIVTGSPTVKLINKFNY